MRENPALTISGSRHEGRGVSGQTHIELERQRSVRNLGILDTQPEAAFDALVRAASLVCETPIALLSLLDADRIWFKAQVGLPEQTEIKRDLSFCRHTIDQRAPLEISDALNDARFKNNPLVADAPHVRFYAGVPLTLGDGMTVGTLCVIDQEPRELRPEQRAILQQLGIAAVHALEGRRALQLEQDLRDELGASLAASAQSEAQFRAFSDSSPLGIFAADASGKLHYTNARWQTIFGCAEDEGLGDGWIPFVRADERDAVVAAWRQTFESGSSLDHRYTLSRPDGTVRIVHARAEPISTDSDKVSGYVGSVEDITEVHSAQVVLEQDRQRMADILIGTGAGTWEWNVQTGETRFNERWAQIIGYSLEELSPTSIATWARFSHPDDLAHSNSLLEKHFAGESESYECEARMQHRDGHWVWVLDRGRVLSWTADGKPEWMFGTHLDITLRKEQEAALRKSEALLNRTGEVAGVGGWELDLATNALKWTSQTRSIYGIEGDRTPPLEEAIEFYAPEARPVIQAAVDKAIETGKGWDLELPFIRADGRRIWVRAVGEVEFDDGQPVRLVGAFQDITLRRGLHDQLIEQHELLRVTLESIGDAVITTEADGRVSWLNPVAEYMTGWTAQAAKDQPIERILTLVHEETRAIAQNPVRLCLETGKMAGLASNTVLVSRTGSEFGIEDSASPIRNRSGEIVGAVLVFHDVTEQRRVSSEMHYRATHDALTTLANRAEFETRLEHALQVSRHDGVQCALMYIDLDQFKLINDTCGHGIGDQFLQNVAKLLGGFVRSTDTLARLGGDEFGIILEHCPLETAHKIAQRICEQMDKFRLAHDGRRLRVGASIGLVPVDERWLNTSAIMQAADSACYAAKEAGRNQVHVWHDTDEVMLARHGDMQWATRLEHALDEHEFELHGQRITALTDEVTGLHIEVLLRLRDGAKGLVMPNAFMPAAERFQLASRLDRWVLREVVALLKGTKQLDHIACLSLNLSGQSVSDPAFHREALALFERAGPQICKRLCLEITETVAVTNIIEATRFISSVRHLGVKVALDDFGSGSSSFGYLKMLPIDIIKIDGGFIRNLLHDPIDAAAVRCFVDVAGIVGVKTVAEFVDNDAVLERVRALGIDFAQGGLHHAPEPIEGLINSGTVAANL